MVRDALRRLRLSTGSRRDRLIYRCCSPSLSASPSSPVSPSATASPSLRCSLSSRSHSAWSSSSGSASAPCSVAMTRDGSSMSSPLGKRSGCDHSESRSSGPTASVTRCQNDAASRSRRGRISSPTSVPNACSAGPPVALRRRTVSAIASCLGRRVVAATVTLSTQPSMSASVV